jgi:hypothetical protein
LVTFAVAVITIVTGLVPQLNVMIPPAATAWTTAADVQLAAVPLPTTWFGLLVLTACPEAGTGKLPFGLPNAVSDAVSELVGSGEPLRVPQTTAATSAPIPVRTPSSIAKFFTRSMAPC